MKPTSAGLGLLLLAVAGCRGGQPAGVTDPATAAEQPFSGTIILGRPTDRSVTASLMSDRDVQVYLEYGITAGTYAGRTASVSLKAGVPANIELSTLQPDTRYRYRVRTGTGATNPVPAPKEYGLRTQRAPGQSFTFTIDADPHHGDASFDSTIYAATMARIAADTPDFHIDLGDSFMTEKLGAASYAQAAADVAALRPYWGISGPSVPLYLVIGNHEGEQGWDAAGAESLPVWATKARQLYYPNPVPNAFYSGSTSPDPLVGVRDGWYAWTWGDVLFVVLDPYWYVKSNPNRAFWQWTLGPDQYAWLKATLRGSQARYKLVFAHQLLGGILGNPRGGIEAAPLYEWGGQNADGTWGFTSHRPGWEKPIHQLFLETGVTAFFHGHDHFFGYQQLDGIVYQEVPQPSYARTSDNSSAAEYGYTHGVILGSSGYLRVRVTPAQATVEYVKVYPATAPAGMQTGQIAYSYTMAPRR